VVLSIPLRKKPSNYMAGDQFFYAFELEESTLPYVIDKIGADKLLYSSDYPHWTRLGQTSCGDSATGRTYRRLTDSKSHGLTRKNFTASRLTRSKTIFDRPIQNYQNH
jgi:hypothetical protein